MSLLGTRVTRRWAVLLDRRGHELGRLEGVAEGSIEASAAATIKSSGSLTLHDRGQTIDWYKVRIQPWIEVNGEAWPLGVFLPSKPSTITDGTKRQWSVQLLDRLTVLDEDVAINDVELLEGAVVTDHIRSLIASTGETHIAITDSSETLRTGRTWDAGTSLLRIVNDLAESINYLSLFCDAQGNYRVDPYVDPAELPVAWNYGEVGKQIHLPSMELEQDLYKIPNRVLATSQSSGEEPALRSVALNTNPDSPLSYASRGRWVTHVETGVEVTSQTVLNEYAQRRLVELSSSAATTELSVAPIPHLGLNRAMKLTSTSLGLSDARFVTQRYTINYSDTALATVGMRQVVTT